MFKMFFKLEKVRQAEHLVQSLSLLFLTPTSNIIAGDVWTISLRGKKIENFSINDLLTYTVCSIKGVPSMTIVDFKKPFKSDDKFIDSFKDNYLGTVRDKVSKSDLVKLAKLQSKLEYNNRISNWLNPLFLNLKNTFDAAGLTDQEYEELKKLFKISNKQVDDWVKSRSDKIEKEIKPLTKFIVRGF